MNCPQCGQANDPSATFCGNCGYALQPAGQPVAATQAAAPVQPVASAAQPVSPTEPVASGQPDSHIANAYNNPTAVQPVSVPMGSPNVSPSGTIAMPNASTTAHPGEAQGIASLVLGVLGIPGALIPILGLALGIAGVVLGTISHSHAKRKISIFGIGVSILAILLSLGVWVYNIEHLHKDATVGSSSISSTTSSGSQAISTPCFTTTIGGGFSTVSPSGCNFTAENTGQHQVVEVEAVDSSAITTSNFSSTAQSVIQQVASTLGLTLSSQSMGTFAGSPSDVANISDSQGSKGVLAIVLHPTSNGDNLFVIEKADTNGQNPTFGSVESDWKWK